jgi:signal transduction histidine kinase
VIPERLRRAAEHRDVALALALLALGYAELFGHTTYQGRAVWPGPLPANLVLIPAVTLPLAWRRRRPLASYVVLVAVGSAAALVFTSGEATAGFVAAFAGVFSATAYAGRPWLVATLAVVAVVIQDLRDPQNNNLESLLWGLGVLAVAWLLGRAARGRQRTIGTLERQAQEQQRRHEAAVAAATAAERASIARELHDIVAHTVSVIVIQSQAGGRALPDRPDVAAQVLSTIESSGRSALAELRRLLTLLAPDATATVSPAPSLAQLGELVDSYRAAGLTVTVDGDRPPVLDPATDLAAYRVVQEALTNTLRHAPGARARLTVTVTGRSLRLAVQDDGGSRDHEPAVDDGTGRGLIGMKERLRLVGGTLVVAGRRPRDDGFRVEAVLPLTDMATDAVADPAAVSRPVLT